MVYLKAVKEDEAQRQERTLEMYKGRQFDQWNAGRPSPYRFPHEELPGLAWGAIRSYPERYTMRVKNAVFELGPKRYRIWASPGFVHVERMQ